MWLTMLMAGSALAILGATADAAKEAFTRTKPHVSVGSIGGHTDHDLVSRERRGLRRR
jgi:hypothetical protein